MTDVTRDATWPSTTLSGLTELRVHGVGGTPPAVMLGTPAPVQVTGDRVAGCWRAPDLADDSGRTRHVEAYAWGGLTARSLISALWLFALPFALVNVAGWMAPERGSRSFGGLVRLAGLAVTGLYVTFACAAAMDFAAYQCAGASERGLTCASTDWWPIGVGYVAHDPSRRVVVGSVVPLLLVGTLWLATRRSRRAYEEYGAEGDARGEDGLVQHGLQGLENPGFWRGEGYAGRLAEIHLAVGFAVVAYLVARTAQDFTDSRLADAVVLVSAATLVAGLLLACFSSVRRRLPQWAAVGFAITQVVLAAIAGWWGEPRTPADPPVFLPGSTDVFGLFVGLLVPTVVATFVVAWVAGRRAASWTRRLRWALTPAALLTTAYMLALTVLAGLVLSVAGLLGDAAGYREGVESAAIEYAQAFEVLARGVVVSASVALVTIAAAWLVRGTTAGTRGLARAEQDWAPMTGPDGWSDARASSVWLARVRRACRFPVASLASVEWGVWVTSVVAVTGALWYGVRWAEEMNRRDWSQQHIEVDIGWLEQVPLGLCTWLLTAVPLVAVLVLRRAIVSPSTRRSMAIAWDVSTFWPRSYHPLAPPSYAERAVPELQARLLRLWGGQDGAPGSVLLLGHSQGSVLVAAAIASLPHDTGDPLARRLGVVTYGSPIRRLYARHFPAYFTTGLTSRLFDRLREPGSEGVGWFNGYRDTDFVGHRITAEGDPDAAVDCYFVDPPHPFAPPGDSSPPVRAHSEGGYRRQGPFRARVASEATRLEPGGQDVSP